MCNVDDEIAVVDLLSRIFGTIRDAHTTDTPEMIQCCLTCTDKRRDNNGYCPFGTCPRFQSVKAGMIIIDRD